MTKFHWQLYKTVERFLPILELPKLPQTSKLVCLLLPMPFTCDVAAAPAAVADV